MAKVRKITQVALGTAFEAACAEDPAQKARVLKAAHQHLPGLSKGDAMAVQLRQAVVTDLPAIYRGEERYIRCWEPEHEAAWRSQLGRHLSRWVENFDRLTVALVSDQFAGYSLWTPEQDHAELCTIHVGPAYRRNGVGMVLLAAWAVDAAKAGFTRLQLSVRPDNPARTMYEKAGFQCIGSGAHGYLLYERRA